MSAADDKDPFDDPFAEEDYDPTAAFAFQARTQLREKLSELTSVVTHHEQQSLGDDGVIARSAKKTVSRILDQLRVLNEDVERAVNRVLSTDSDSQAHQMAVSEAIAALHESLPLFDEGTLWAQHVGSLDGPAMTIAPQVISTLEEPRAASAQLLQDLQGWLQERLDDRDGSLVLLHTTPGVGKTHQMLRAASHLQMAEKRRVIFAARTKEMILPPRGEILTRAIATHPLARGYTLPIYGRDDSNCYQSVAVELAQQHGYAPGRAVCMGCEHHPRNAYDFGEPVCGYYQVRVNANNMSRGVRAGRVQQYPMILTTHAALVAATEADGGMYGECWGSDVIFIDEDPTDAIETDVVCSEGQMSFSSARIEHVDTSEMAMLFRSVAKIAAAQRSEASSNGFCASGTKEKNSHPIHSRYDSVFASGDLWRLLEYAQQASGSNLSVAELLRNVVESGSFQVMAGDLSGVSSVLELNNRDIPPRTLFVMADALLREARHREDVARSIYEKITGEHGSLSRIKSSTDAEDLAYQVRLECIPASYEKGRLTDEWRFVFRQTRSFNNTASTLVVGDAYAQKDHYRYLFEREPEVIQSVASLHPDAKIIRVLHSGANIGELNRGGFGDILAAAETFLRDHVQPGDRVLVYGHSELRPRVEKFLESVRDRYDLTAVAYEHWWGGRGKDAYNGWEHVITISDPILSIGGLKHVVNARAFRDSEKAWGMDKVKSADRIRIGSIKHGILAALRNGHPRLALEHERSNVAEMTQALHRARPVHNATHLYTIGEMERSPDLLAQTVTFVPSDERFESVSSSRRRGKTKRADARVPAIEGSLQSFVTTHEMHMGVRAIVDHFGVWHPYFTHALVTAANTHVRVRGMLNTPCSDRDSLSQDAMFCEVGADGFQCRELPAWSNKDPIRPRWQFAHIGTHQDDSEPLSRNPSLFPCHFDMAHMAQCCATATRGRSAGANANDDGHLPQMPLPKCHDGSPVRSSLAQAVDVDWGAEAGLDGVLRTLPSTKSLLGRIWDPPVWWEALSKRENLPRAIEQMSDQDFRSLGLVPFTPSRDPSWMSGRRGPKAKAWYDPAMLGVRPDIAERLLFRILDNQYGFPRSHGGMDRPNFVPTLPKRLKVPF